MLAATADAIIRRQEAEKQHVIAQSLLEAEHEDAEEWKAQAEEAAEKALAAEAVVESLRSELQEARQQLEESRAAAAAQGHTQKALLMQLQQKEKRRRQEEDALRSKVTELEAVLERSVTAGQDQEVTVAQLREQLRVAEQLASTKTAELESTVGALRARNADVFRLEAHLSEAKDQIRSLNHRCAELEMRLAQQTETLKASTERVFQLEMLPQDLAALQDQNRLLETAHAEDEVLQKRLRTSLQLEQDARRSLEAALRETTEKLEFELPASRREAETLRNQIRLMEARISEIMGLVSEKDFQHSALLDQFKRENERVRALEKKLEEPCTCATTRLRDALQLRCSEIGRSPTAPALQEELETVVWIVQNRTRFVSHAQLLYSRSVELQHWVKLQCRVGNAATTFAQLATLVERAEDAARNLVTEYLTDRERLLLQRPVDGGAPSLSVNRQLHFS